MLGLGSWETAATTPGCEGGAGQSCPPRRCCPETPAPLNPCGLGQAQPGSDHQENTAAERTPLKHPHPLLVPHGQTPQELGLASQRALPECFCWEAAMLIWPGLCPGHSSTRQVSVELALQKDRVCGRSCSTAERLLSTCWLQDLRERSFHFFLMASAMCSRKTDGPLVRGALISDTDHSREAPWAPVCCSMCLKEHSSWGSSALALPPPLLSLCAIHCPRRGFQGILCSPHGLLGHLTYLGQCPLF